MKTVPLVSLTSFSETVAIGINQSVTANSRTLQASGLEALDLLARQSVDLVISGISNQTLSFPRCRKARIRI
jgi:hypothetical protein